jgi:hypothetical protein
MGVRYCVYDEDVSRKLSELSEDIYNDILTAQRLFPGVDYRMVISMGLHKAATFATNSALGDSLDKLWNEQPPAALSK